MADLLVTDLESEIRRELEDPDGTEWADAEMLDYINEGIELVTHQLFELHKYSHLIEDNSVVYLDDAEFSVKGNEHDLPEDFIRIISVYTDEGETQWRRVTRDLFRESTTESRYMLRSSRIGAVKPNSSNAGTDDLEAYGNYSGSADDTVTITVTGSGTYSWSSVSNGSGTGSMSTSWTTLAAGIQIRWGSTSGYTTGDSWTIAVKNTYKPSIISLNADITEDLEVYYVSRESRLALSGGSMPATYLPYRRYYLPIKAYVILKCRNRNEENISQDARLKAPIMKMISDIASSITDDDAGSFLPNKQALDML